MDRIAQPAGKVSAGLAPVLCLSLASVQRMVSAKPAGLLDKSVEGMPVFATQKVRMLTAAFEPGQKTAVQTRGFPVAVSSPGGEVGLDIDGKAAAAPVVQILASLDDLSRAAAWADMETQLDAFQTESDWRSPNTLLLSAQKKPLSPPDATGSAFSKDRS